jgi:hypothetical protein
MTLGDKVASDDQLFAPAAADKYSGEVAGAGLAHVKEQYRGMS